VIDQRIRTTRDRLTAVSPRDLSMRASSLVAPAGRAVAPECAARAAGRAKPTDLGGPRDHSLQGYRIAAGATDTFLIRLVTLDFPLL
jgi:hypothetical protein